MTSKLRGTRAVYRNQLYFYIPTMDNIKVKLRKQFVYNSNKKSNRSIFNKSSRKIV